MASLLQRAGYRSVSTPEEAELVIVNTCGFIAPAREESLAVLKELAAAKKPGQLLIAAGCYAQRSPADLARAVPGVDALIGTRHWMEICAFIEQLRTASPSQRPIYHQLTQGFHALGVPHVPAVAIQGGSAYLKIGDGCSRRCAFCAIPLIKGPAFSRPPDQIVADAVRLVEAGVQEIVLISQDITSYGRDLGMENGLITLVERLVEAVPSLPWIRLMYAFPNRVVERLAELMVRYPQVLPYLDIPLQHAHPNMLRRMRRPYDVQAIRRTIAHLRERVPQVALRTTFLVGYPGETDAEFEALESFVAEMAFDHVGVFTYSHEEGTAAGRLTDNVPPEVKEERRARLMEIQQAISLAKHRALLGQTLDVLIEGQDEGISVGRSYRDAPEIDGLVIIRASLPVGRIVPVRVVEALEYDLIGVPV